MRSTQVSITRFKDWSRPDCEDWANAIAGSAAMDRKMDKYRKYFIAFLFSEPASACIALAGKKTYQFPQAVWPSIRIIEFLDHRLFS